ncbi:hypothetical protein HCN44_007554 [Aphidius gifuensis]|uniref:Uncharacterized protein n=1 Tax=Aphidius gifuensis TaxID=684658 RepID=A0A834XMM4_APHGI|nr:hypothetical protein HCN44_007554 [Aphidius gifuensis]
MSKKQIVVGVNNLEQILKKFSLEEQSKYEDLVEKNTNTFEVIMPLFSSCLKNYNLLGTAMRCIEQHQNKKNATENEFYQNFQNLLVTYNSILIPQINIIERKFITAIIVDISVIEIKNKEELLKEKSDIAISSPAQPIKIYCEKNTLEDKYETGRENLWSISIHHDNITSFFEKIDGEYNHLSDLFKDQNINGIDDFIELSKKQTVMEVNNLAQDLNKFSLEEQSKYDLVFRTHIETFNKNIPLFINCLKNYNSFKKSLRCIDQHQNSRNKTEHEHYGNIQNLLDTYNSVLIPEVKDVERNFITAANKILSHAKNNNNELIKRKSTADTISSTTILRLENTNLNLNCAVEFEDNGALFLEAEQGLYYCFSSTSPVVTVIRGIVKVKRITLNKS